MIVEPDFPDHKKTRLLVNKLGGDEAAPVYVLRLWGHCQATRRWQFNDISPEALKSLCGYPGHANKLASSLVASGFIRVDGSVLVVRKWEQYNASLVRNWKNGVKGGRSPTSGDEIRSKNPAEPKRNRSRGIRIESLDSLESPDPLGFQPAGGPSLWTEKLCSDVLEDAELIAQVVPTAGDDRLACCRIAFLVRSRLLPYVWLDTALSEYRKRDPPPRKPHGWLLTKLRKSALAFEVSLEAFNERFGVEVPAAVWTRVSITKGTVT